MTAYTLKTEAGVSSETSVNIYKLSCHNTGKYWKIYTSLRHHHVSLYLFKWSNSTVPI